jgi:hypothetical protein
MHSRRFASFLIGAWLAASIFMDVVAIQNFRSVDRFLSDPGPLAAADIHMLGKGEARILLRHQAGEANRFLFEKSEQIQIVLGIAFIGALLFAHMDAPRVPMILGLLMLAILAVDRFYLTPEITRLGRQLDYATAPNGDTAVFWRLHGFYSGLELLKLALGFTAATLLIVRFRDRKFFAREHASSPSVSARG